MSSNNYTTLSYTDTLAVVRAALFTPGYKGAWGLPMLLVGPPGVGKSAGTGDLAQACGLLFKALIGSIRDPADFGGYPAADPDDRQFARALLPQWLRDLAVWGKDGQGGVLLLDELTTIPLSVQSAMLALVLDRMVGDFKIPARVRPLLAANPTELAVCGVDLAAPTSNRMGHLWWEGPSLDEWEAALDRDGAPLVAENALEVEAEVERQWPAAYARARKIVLGYLRKVPGNANQCPKPGSPDSSAAWPSLRSWEFAMRALASSAIHGLSEEQRDGFVASFVGRPVAVAFLAWLRDADLPDALDVLDGRVRWSPNPARPDRTQTVFALLADALSRDNGPQALARGRVFWQAVIAAEDCPDLALRAVTKLAVCTSGINQLPEAVQARRAVLPVAQAVNLGGLRSQ